MCHLHARGIAVKGHALAPCQMHDAAACLVPRCLSRAPVTHNATPLPMLAVSAPTHTDRLTPFSFPLRRAYMHASVPSTPLPHPCRLRMCGCGSRAVGGCSRATMWRWITWPGEWCGAYEARGYVGTWMGGWVCAHGVCKGARGGGGSCGACSLQAVPLLYGHCCMPVCTRQVGQQAGRLRQGLLRCSVLACMPEVW